MESEVINWQDPHAYDPVRALSWNGIAHEFRRRGNQYRRDYENQQRVESSLREKYGPDSTLDDWLDDVAPYYLDPPALPGESFADWEQRTDKECGRGYWLLLNEYNLRKHGLVSRMPPPDEIPRVAPTTRLISCPRFIRLDEIDDYSPIIHSAGLKLVVIDPNADLEAQLDHIATNMMEERDPAEVHMLRRLPRTKDGAIRLLRLIDARTAGAAPEEVQAVLYGDGGAPGQSQALNAGRHRADEELADWVAAGGYRHLAARHAECWIDWA